LKKHTAKRAGLGLEFKTFNGKSGKSYIVFRTPKGGYHAFAEVDAKEAAIDCFAPKDRNTRAQWKAVWDAFHQVKKSEPTIPKPSPTDHARTMESIRDRLSARRRP
jgi:hypothetical protein